MPCHLVTFDTASNTRSEYDCDEANTSRIVEDDFGAKVTAAYADIDGKPIEIDWTHTRLVSFARKRDDGTQVFSGGADGSQTPVC
jgi:hypothetical protein